VNGFAKIGHYTVNAANDTVFCCRILQQHLSKNT